MLNNIHNWLIKKIAGNKIVILNSEFQVVDGGLHINGRHIQKGIIEGNIFKQPLS